MTHPDDARDLAIHQRIEGMIDLFMGLRAMTRSEVFEQLCNGSGMFDHGLNAIAEMFSASRHEVNERVTAFIEAEKEELISRAIRIALAAEVDA